MKKKIENKKKRSALRELKQSAKKSKLDIPDVTARELTKETWDWFTEMPEDIMKLV